MNHLDREIVLKHWPGAPAMLNKSAAVARRLAAWVPARVKARVFGGGGLRDDDGVELGAVGRRD